MATLQNYGAVQHGAESGLVQQQQNNPALTQAEMMLFQKEQKVKEALASRDAWIMYFLINFVAGPVVLICLPICGMTGIAACSSDRPGRGPPDACLACLGCGYLFYIVFIIFSAIFFKISLIMSVVKWSAHSSAEGELSSAKQQVMMQRMMMSNHQVVVNQPQVATQVATQQVNQPQVTSTSQVHQQQQQQNYMNVQHPTAVVVGAGVPTTGVPPTASGVLAVHTQQTV